jgi:hypothetical protein
MKRILLGAFVGILIGGVAAWSFLKRHEGGEKEEAKKEEAHEPHVARGTNGETILKFDKEAQAKMGLKAAELAAAQFQPELKATGRALDASALSIAINDIALSKAQLEASQRELERVKLLFGQNQNVSARAVEAAELAVSRDRLAAEAARLRLASTWGPSVIGMKNLEEFARAALEQKAALVRLDVPAGADLGEGMKAGRVALLSAPSKILPAQFLGPASSADAQSQSIGFLLQVNSPRLVPGAPLLGWLSLGGKPESGVIVPRDAIVRHQGEVFIYAQRGDDAFERIEIELEHPTEQGWFTAALKPPLKVVVNGAQQLLSEEFKGEAESEAE